MKRINSEEEELLLRQPFMDCERQVCVCSPPDIPIRRYKHENGRACGNFQREDHGCWRLFVGGAPKRICEDDCWCSCHTTKVEDTRPWNHEWADRVENLKQKWRNN